MDTHPKRSPSGHRLVTPAERGPDLAGERGARRARLHAKNVGRLQAPADGAWIWWDTTPETQDAPRGFGVRVTSNGVRAYVVKYRVHGVQRVATLGRTGDMSLAKARELARQHREAAREGRDPVAEEQARRLRGDTVAALVEKYLASRHVQTLRTAAEYERLLTREVIPVIGAMPPGEVRRGDVRALVEKIAERSGSVANRTLGVLQALYSWAVKNDLLERAPAWPDPPAREVARARLLSDDEILAIWLAIEAECAEPNLVGWAFKLMLVTAQRRGEVLRMRWRDISREPDGAWWTIPAAFTKNARDHRVPLTTTALEITESAKRIAELRGLDTSEWVFPSDRKSARGHLFTPSHGLGRVRNRCASIPDWRLHDFRRTAATRMGEDGIPRVHVAAILNHTAHDEAPRVTSIYYRPSFDDKKRVALEAWERRLQSILTHGTRPANITPITAARA